MAAARATASPRPPGCSPDTAGPRRAPGACTEPARAKNAHAHLRTHYRDEKARLLATLQNSGASTRALHTTLQQLARLADHVLRALWQHTGFDEGPALVAVGGFGRGELFPHSDIDVLVLLPDGCCPDDDGALKSRLEAFIGACWDVGLEIGSSVRSLSDCVEEAARDVTVQTSLLESRHVAGARALYQRFQRRFRQ